MKEKLLEGLKTKYSNLGLGDAVLSGVTATLENNTTEDNLEATIAGAEGLLKTLQSELDKARSKREPKIEPIAELKVEPKVDNEFAELRKMVEGLTTKLEQTEQEKLAEKKFNELAKVAKTKGISEDILKLVNIPEDVEINTFLDSLSQTLTNVGLKGTPPIGGRKDERTDLEKSIDRVREKMNLNKK